MPTPKLPGIYRIVNIANNKSYVGQTRDLRDRKKRHFHALRKNSHKNPHLQAAYNHYGEEAFVFEVLEIAVFPPDFESSPIAYREYLKPYEQKWMDFYNSANREYGYNLTPSAATNLGVVRSKETRARLSAINKGKTIPAETREKIGAAHRGMTRSDQMRARLSEAKCKYTYVVGLPNGEEAIIFNLKEFCAVNGLSYTRMLDIVHGRCK